MDLATAIYRAERSLVPAVGSLDKHIISNHMTATFMEMVVRRQYSDTTVMHHVPNTGNKSCCLKLICNIMLPNKHFSQTAYSQ